MQEIIIYNSPAQARLYSTLDSNPEFILGFMLWAFIVIVTCYYFIPLFEIQKRKRKIKLGSSLIVGIVMVMSFVLAYAIFN